LEANGLSSGDQVTVPVYSSVSVMLVTGVAPVTGAVTPGIAAMLIVVFLIVEGPDANPLGMHDKPVVELKPRVEVQPGFKKGEVVGEIVGGVVGEVVGEIVGGVVVTVPVLVVPELINNLLITPLVIIPTFPSIFILFAFWNRPT